MKTEKSKHSAARNNFHNFEIYRKNWCLNSDVKKIIKSILSSKILLPSGKPWTYNGGIRGRYVRNPGTHVGTSDRRKWNEHLPQQSNRMGVLQIFVLVPAVPWLWVPVPIMRICGTGPGSRHCPGTTAHPCSGSIVNERSLIWIFILQNAFIKKTTDLIFLLLKIDVQNKFWIINVATLVSFFTNIFLTFWTFF